MRLVADIGGTKALLGLVEHGAQPPRYVAMERLVCAQYPSFAALLSAFFSKTQTTGRQISGGCLAVAGPVAEDGRRVRMTNLPWTLDVEALADDFGTGPLRLINDFTAAALGTTQIPEADLVTLQAGEPSRGGVRLVVGAGTGLGMAVLVEVNGAWRVLPGEGGHAGFAPADETQAALWRHLQQQHGRVEFEHVVSGPGLSAIYGFLAPDAAAGGDDPAMIAAQAAENPGSPARRAFDIFLAAYGAFAGDMALALNARGGVYLAGGIAAANVALMQSGVFVDAFNAKGKHSALARRMPVSVVTDRLLGINGAARYDRNFLAMRPNVDSATIASEKAVSTHRAT